MTDLRGASRNARRAAQRRLENERLSWPTGLVRLPVEQHPIRPSTMTGPMPVEIWRSRDFLLQVFPVDAVGVIERLSVNRTRLSRSGDWRDDISWEELQDLKRQCGRGEFDAVEIYPDDADVVNVANMRHLWVFKASKIPFAWRSRK